MRLPLPTFAAFCLTSALFGCEEQTPVPTANAATPSPDDTRHHADQGKAPQTTKATNAAAPATAQEPKAGATAPKESAPSAAIPPADAPRVYAKSRHVWVRSMPTSKVQWIGYLWWGGSVKLRDEEPVAGDGCSKKWFPVEPRGWVCADDKEATLNPEDPELLAVYPYRGNVESAWPHKYALVHAPLTIYEGLPGEELQQARERGYRGHIEMVRKSRKAGNSDIFADFLGKVDVSLSGKPAISLPALPKGLSEGRTRLVGRSAIAYVAEAEQGDRDFLLTADLGWIPKDRVELVEPSQFRGVELGKGLHLPLAFFRGKARPGFKQNANGSFEEIPETFARHAVVQLSEEKVQEGRVTFYKVEGQDLWVNDREAVVPTPREQTPWGAPIGQPDTTGLARNGRATWLEASILGGWLVAFEGTQPVYATMISAGRGGKPHPGKDPLETASTPTGRFPIGGKFKTATMESSSSPIVHAEVPWTQNFSGPYAIHSAYWHDNFGHLMSAGCVNVAPLDGKWLFDFTEPEVPEGWHGVRYVGRYGGGSTLFIVHE